jgi:hypothetical protein
VQAVADPLITLQSYRKYRQTVTQSTVSPQATLYRKLPPRLALAAVPQVEAPGEAGKVWRDQTERLRSGELTPDEFSDWMDDWLSHAASATR